MTQQRQDGGYQWRVPAELEGGVYANLVGVWHTPYEFTLDFAAALQAEQVGESVVVPARVTSRVKLPVTVIFDLIRALNENMTKYEAQHGAIVRPGEPQPLPPPDDLIGGA